MESSHSKLNSRKEEEDINCESIISKDEDETVLFIRKKGRFIVYKTSNPIVQSYYEEHRKFPVVNATTKSRSLLLNKRKLRRKSCSSVVKVKGIK